MNKQKKLLAIDNSSTKIGFAFFQGQELHDYWDLTLKGKTSGERMLPYYNKLKEYFSLWQPDEVAIETPGGKGWSIRVLSEFLGIVKLVTYQAGLKDFLYAPTSIKLTATGSGRAKKEDIINWVKIKYNEPMKDLGYPVLTEDSADAIALGYTHLVKTA